MRLQFQTDDGKQTGAEQTNGAGGKCVVSAVPAALD
jgi:hypothetical protein